MTSRDALTEVHAWRVDLDARQTGLNRLLGRFNALSRAIRIPTAVRRDLHLALDEIVSNIIHANGDRASTRIRVQLYLTGTAASLEVADNGRKFDPTAAPPPRGRALDRPIGGVGLHIVRGLMDSMEYARRGGRNHLVVTRALKRSAKASRSVLQH